MKSPKSKMIEVWGTQMGGTVSMGKFRAKNRREAISKAKKKDGKKESSRWTYYCPENQFKKIP